MISSPQYKDPNGTFAYDVAFTKGTTDEDFYDTPGIYSRKFDDYNGFSTSPAVGTFGPNYVYAAAGQLIYSVSNITAIVPAVCTVFALVCYWINGLSIRNHTVDVNKMSKLFLFNP